jgi:hypothetical protein
MSYHGFRAPDGTPPAIEPRGRHGRVPPIA